MLKAEDLPPGTRVHHHGEDAKKIDFNLWLAAKPDHDEWLCDRQVNYLLDTGATAHLPEPSDQATT